MSVVIIVIVIGVPLVAIVLSIAAFIRAGRVKELLNRVDELETALHAGAESPGPDAPEPPTPRDAEVVAPVEVEVFAPSAPPVAVPRSREPIQWEKFVGEKAIGWSAIVLLIFAATFFLRYAYQNNWIGPIGRVAIATLVGAGLLVAGQRYLRRGWRRFAQMLSGGGVVLLYLATYSAFGFYHLLPQQHAGVFLIVIVIESMVIAALCDSLVIGLMAVVGGLLTPVLLHSDQDSYRALFTFLAVLDLGVIVLMLSRSWPAIGTVALLGSHGLFWYWHAENYHPEKLGWALGFQGVVFGLFLGQTVISQLVRKRPETWEGLARLVLNAVLWFTAFYALMNEEHRVWMGSAAVVMAIVYAALARVTFAGRHDDQRLLLGSLAVAVGFVALAFPIQADAHWVAFGWAAIAATLWWFGQRISAISLRGIAAVLILFAMYRVVLFDTWHVDLSEQFTPIFNEFALPSIGVAVLVLVAIVATRSFVPRLSRLESVMVAAGGMAGVLLLWLVLTVDCYAWFGSRSQQPGADAAHERWMGQLSVSVLWSVFALVVLATGFVTKLARLRWLAIGLLALTVGKVMLIDMADLGQFYRILAFLVLAVVLGLAARAYQRLSLSEPDHASEGNE